MAHLLLSCDEPYRSDLKPARTSSEKSFGCSQAAKWPPLGSSNVEPIDLGNELRQDIQSCLAFAPVIFRAPIARERLSRRELHALGCICDRFPFRPLGVVDASAQFAEFRLRDMDLK